MRSEPHIVSLAAVTWDFSLVGRTRMLTEAWMAAHQPTTFVQVPSLRTALERVTRGAVSRHEPVIRPWPTLPAALWSGLSFEWLDASARVQARRLRRLLDARLDWSSSVALVVSPIWTPWLDELPFAKVVYDCIDDLNVHVPRPSLRDHYQRWEEQLIRRCDAGVVTAEGLLGHLQHVRADVPLYTIRNGVNTEAFRRSLAAPRPADVPQGRPVIGFVGALYSWVDWDLIEATARSMPDCRFVMVGPWDANAPIERIRAAGNVTFLGHRPYAEVPSYIASFDVCWVPFDQSRVSTLANPVKIYEYLALGKPVVTTPVADTSSFNGLVRVGRTPEEIRTMLESALREGTSDSEARVAFARANDWSVRARDYVHLSRALFEPTVHAAASDSHGPEMVHASRDGGCGNTP